MLLLMMLMSSTRGTELEQERNSWPGAEQEVNSWAGAEQEVNSWARAEQEQEQELSSWTGAEQEEQECSEQELLQLQEKYQKCTFALLIEFEERKHSSPQDPDNQVR